MIIYHGASDPAIPASRSIMFWHELAATTHGSDKATTSVRLFLVSGMQHCSCSWFPACNIAAVPSGRTGLTP